MNMLILLLGIMGIYSAFGICVREIYRRKWIKELKEMAVTERNRNRFGVLRTELMRLARNEELNVHSSTFKSLYAALTGLMRSPDSYKDIAGRLLNRIRIIKHENQSDASFFTRGEATLLLEMARSLDALYKDYSIFYRWLAWYYEQSRESDTIFPLWVKLIFNNQESVQEAKKLHLAQEELEKLAEEELELAPL